MDHVCVVSEQRAQRNYMNERDTPLIILDTHSLTLDFKSKKGESTKFYLSVRVYYPPITPQFPLQFHRRQYYCNSRADWLLLLLLKIQDFHKMLQSCLAKNLRKIQKSNTNTME